LLLTLQEKIKYINETLVNVKTKLQENIDRTGFFLESINSRTVIAKDKLLSPKSSGASPFEVTWMP
jgi:hypothetical protein